MDTQPDPAGGFKGLVQWATTPPQSYLIYVIALVLVLGLSYYAGTIKRQLTAPPVSPPVSAPRN